MVFQYWGFKGGGKKAHLQTETLFYPLYVYKKHTVNAGGKKAGGKKAGVKGGGKRAGGKKACYPFNGP